MAKNPEDRYATAQELADDLRRFLDDQPVRARRPSLAQRLARWSRRHRTLVASAFVVLLVAVVCLSVSTWLIWLAQQETEGKRREATAAMERAKSEEARALTAEADKETERLNALGQKDRAEANALKALEVLDTVYLPMLETQLPRNPTLTPQDQSLMEGVMGFYESFARDMADNPKVRRKLRDAYRRVGHIRTTLNQFEEGEKAYVAALDLCRRLEEEFPAESAHRVYRAGLYTALGILCDFAGERDP